MKTDVQNDECSEAHPQYFMQTVSITVIVRNGAIIRKKEEENSILSN